MPNDFDMLINKLKRADSIAHKNKILDEQEEVINFLKSNAYLMSMLNDLPINYEYVLKILMAISQASIVLHNIENISNSKKLLNDLCETLLSIEDFYHPIGGLLGYHNQFIKLLKETLTNENVKYLEPEYADIRTLDKNIEEFIKTGLESLEKFAFICPMGGAGDRLNLFDPKTNAPLPSAILNFYGHTLIEHLIRDIQALEYLYFKTYNKELTTPLIIMTSDEKHNHDLIVSVF